MAETHKPEEIRKRYRDLPYITPYERIVALVDERAGLVELHEFHGRGRCSGGAAWEVYHYARTSPLVTSARREGARNATLGRATLRVPAAAKLVIGVDDTDDARRGATWSTVNEMAFALEQEGVCRYLGHTIVQLFPDNPYKTTNCCSTAVVLGVRPSDAGPVKDSLAALGAHDETDGAVVPHTGDASAGEGL